MWGGLAITTTLGTGARAEQQVMDTAPPGGSSGAVATVTSGEPGTWRGGHR